MHRRSNSLDNYEKDRTGFTDLTWIGNNQTDSEESDLICEFCNVALIEKLDDIAHLRMSYNRWICSKCGTIVDPRYNSNNVKHAESLHTLTDDGTNSTEAHVEVLTVNDEIKTGRKQIF